MNTEGSGEQPQSGAPEGQQGSQPSGPPPYPSSGVHPQGGYQSPGYTPPSYPPPGPPQYGQPHGQPQYGQPQYGQPQYGYQQPGYGQQGYPDPGYPPAGGYHGPQQGWALKPGIVPLRPLDLGTLYNGAVAAIRANPGVMLGTTAIVVVVSQLLTFLAQWPLLRVEARSVRNSGDTSLLADLGSSVGTSLVAGAITAIATCVLTGMLTIVIARSVFGEKTGAGQAWAAVRPRILSLIGLLLLQFVIFAVPIAIVVGIVIAVGAAGSGGLAVAVAVLLGIAVFVGYLALLPLLALAPATLVLERLGPIGALQRAWALQRRGYWRLLGILLLTSLITGVIAGVVSVPFSIGGTVTALSSGSDGMSGTSLTALALTAVGAAIGQIITLPFMSSVNTLLYTDQRMRTEAFDLVLQTEAMRRSQTGAPGVPVDDLWLTQRAPSVY